MIKKITFTLYAIVILVMAMATFIGQSEGQDFVASNIFGAWWFSLLWAALCAMAVFYFLKRKVRRYSIIALHLAFVIILAGALLTHLTAQQGTVHLREGESRNTFMCTDASMIHEMESLPFTITLNRFQVKYHPGTKAPYDYASYFTIDNKEEGSVSMNNIYSNGGVRLYQSGYDQDMKGTYLSVNIDPFGIPVTYTGYCLLFISLLWLLIDPKGTFRQLLKAKGKWRKPKAKSQVRSGVSASKALIIALLLSLPTLTQAQNNNNKSLPEGEVGGAVIPESQAEELGQLNILYNDRICPIQTFALDFTKKLYGSSSFEGKTAEQVLSGFLFYSNQWAMVPIIKVNSGEVREKYGLKKYAAFSDFVTGHGYILAQAVEEAYQGNNDSFHKEVEKLDEKLMLIAAIQHTQALKIFPYRGIWYSPLDEFPRTMEKERALYFKNAFPMLEDYAHSNDWRSFSEMVSKMQKYQYTFGADAIPSKTAIKAERIYNTIPFATILFMLCLGVGFASLIRKRWLGHLASATVALSFFALTFCLALRWIISGTFPMSNGYETMLALAWIILLIGVVDSVRGIFPKNSNKNGCSAIVSVTLIASGFCLLVSHIGQLDPQITPVMPVLNSPLLSIHVSIIMLSYALLALTFMCSVGYFLSTLYPLHSKLSTDSTLSTLHSQLILYPAMTCLGIGIFIGAIWANVSWGNYWGWDPKEVWALITFMIYAVPLHSASFPAFRNPKVYHLYMIFAFLAVLMTYFGVNYFLSGMHSYA